MSRSAGTARSVYMARLRRAFLLRVHPDRFRSIPVRAQQARLVQALSNRMNQPDFIAWQQQQQQQQYVDAYHETATSTSSSSNTDATYPFVLEKRDGSLFQTVLMMNSSVESILSTIIQGLKEVGASLPEPPPVVKGNHRRRTRTTAATTTTTTSSQHGTDEHANNNNNSNNNNTHTIHNNLAGRSLQQFLSNVQQPEEIQKRRNSRVDAQAAALAVRRLYRFQAVDATSLGWSSAWVAILFRRLLDLHSPHDNPWKVDSFYPIRLAFSNAAAKVSIIQSNDHALDVHGGVLRLSPAGTSVQWLDTLASVTYEHMEEIHYYQSQLLTFSKTIQTMLGINVKKGYSCSNAEYYSFLERLSNGLFLVSGSRSATPVGVLQSSFHHHYHLSKKPMVLTVESSQMCRRPMVTPEGKLRLGSAFVDTSTVVRVIAELGPIALQRREEHEALLLQQQEWIQQAQYQLGLQHVYATAAVSPMDFGRSLQRLLTEATRNERLLQQRLGGRSLGIAGSDRFCHLADDGSLVIPHNWVE